MNFEKINFEKTLDSSVFIVPLKRATEFFA